MRGLAGGCGWSHHGFSCSAEESVYAGPQPLGPLLPVGAWAGTDLLAAALHTTLRVCLLPEQKVRSSQGSWGGAGLSLGLWGSPLPQAVGAVGMLGGQNLAGVPGPLGAGCTTQRNPAGSPLQDETGGEMAGSCGRRIRSRASWSKLWPFPCLYDLWPFVLPVRASDEMCCFWRNNSGGWSGSD